MSQDLSGGGRRAQRDKEFFPEMSEREVAKAKSLVIGKTIGKAGGLVGDYKAALLGASGKRAEVSKSGVANGSLSASLFASASTASTIQIESSNEREQNREPSARSDRTAPKGDDKLATEGREERKRSPVKTKTAAALVASGGVKA